MVFYSNSYFTVNRGICKSYFFIRRIREDTAGLWDSRLDKEDFFK